MSDVLIRIKRAMLAGQYAFSEKARMEMETDGLTELDVAESIVNAVAIYKKLPSTADFERLAKEMTELDWRVPRQDLPGGWSGIPRVSSVWRACFRP